LQHSVISTRIPFFPVICNYDFDSELFAVFTDLTPGASM